MSGRRNSSLRAIDSRERAFGKATAALLALAAAFVAMTLSLPHPSGGDVAAQIAIGGAMIAAAPLLWFLGGGIPIIVTRLILAAAVAAGGALIIAGGVAAGGYGSIFVWSTLITSYFFTRRVAAAYLVWTLAVYAVTIASVESTAGFSPVTRWVSTAVSLTVVMMLTTEIVQRRARGDKRARRFFDLSHDMLTTMDLKGRCVELNQAWVDTLGYRTEEMQGRPLLDITHRDDLEQATRQAAQVFKGSAAEGLETRVRAKDGSWRWLRSTATYAEDEGLVYARSTDITELKEVEAEREKLLKEVERLANSDSLTGLPNRRVLEEHLRRELPRARRQQSPLCLGIVDVDRFKAYNDSRGHLAGDALLRTCAMAWDAEIRTEDLLSRFGGEEFVVVFADCPPDLAVTIVERLRAATPDGQTVSAGLVCWDGEETPDDLIERADAALYRAKANGRDQLVYADGD